MKIFRSIGQRINTRDSNHLAILRGLIWVALFVFLGKLAGAFKEMAIAYRYGVSNEVDAYIFVLNLVTWPANIWFSILTYVLVPLAARIREESPEELPRFRAELFGFALILGIDLGLLAWFGLPILLRSSWVGLSTATVDIATGFIGNMTALIPFGILISLFSAWMLSSGRHANTLLEGIPALAILLAVLFLPETGATPLIWGTLAGFLLHTASLASPLAWRGDLGLPRFSSRSAQWPYFWQGFGIMLIGSGLGSFNSIIDQFFAAQLDAGSITTISYANRVLSLILGLGATAIGRATLPVFSRMKSQNGSQLQRVAMAWVWIMFAVGILTLAVCWWLAPWIVAILFERGAFSAANTKVVSEVFRYGLTQVPFYFASLALVTLLASHGKQNLIAISGATNLFVKAGANYFLVPILGMNAIILSSGIMYMVSFFLLLWFGSYFLKHNESTQ